MKNLRYKNQGITLIALVITIVLIILAGVSIATLTGDNGLLIRTNDAKVETALGSVKEALKLEQGEKRIEDKELTPEILLAEGKVTRTVQQKEDEKYYMYYAIKEKAFEGMQGLGKGNLSELKDLFLIDDNLNVKYIASNGKEYGDNIEEKILDDETEIRFSNKTFSEYISKISGIKEEDMKFKWMKNLTNLTINDKSITSIEDLILFPNLIKLEINGLSLENMNGIENCTKLKQLRLTSCNIENYSSCAKLQELELFYNFGKANFNDIIDGISSCKKLKNVTVRNAQIKDMKRISELINITNLNLEQNLITKVEGIENLSNLKTFNIEGNNIKTIDDIIKNTKIEELTAYSCGITSLNGIEKLFNLKKLNVSSNDIRDITPLANNSKLTELNLKNNPNLEADRNNFTPEQLEKIDKIGNILDNGGVINLDVDKLKLFNNYTKLDLSNQNLTTLEPLEGMTNLEQLVLMNNQLTFEDEKSREVLANMTKLKHLDIRYNKITNMTAVNNIKSMKTLYTAGGGNNFNLKDMENLINTVSLHVNTNTLQTLVDCDINKITRIEISADIGITKLPNMEKFINLKTFICTGEPNISNFEILEKIPNLEQLTLNYNNFGENIPIDFSRFNKLKSLTLENNYLTSNSLNFLKNNNNLTNLNLRNNSIVDATALLELNPSTKINLSGNVNLSQDSKDKLKARFGNNVTF